MKYMGSKRLLAKHLLPIILKGRQPQQWYVEPFVGGGNMIDKVKGNRLGADIDEYVIEALKLIRDHPEKLPTGEKNGDTSEDVYRLIQRTAGAHKGFKGYYGYALSYGGKWFGGWCRNKNRTRDYVAEAYRNALKQSPRLQGVVLRHCPYNDLIIPPNSIIYCDPPYAARLQYGNSFNHNLFWEWCLDQSNNGHKVFISEYAAPDDFVCLWEKKVASSLDQATGESKKKETEKLFIPRTQQHDQIRQSAPRPLHPERILGLRSQRLNRSRYEAARA